MFTSSLTRVSVDEKLAVGGPPKTIVYGGLVDGHDQVRDTPRNDVEFSALWRWSLIASCR